MRKYTPAHVFLLLLIVGLAFLEGASPAIGQSGEADHFSFLPLIARRLPVVENIREPLLIDGGEGRIYAGADVDGLPQTVVLAAADGRFLDSFPYTGRLALDRDNHKLLVDQGDLGLAVLDSLNGDLLGVIDFPLGGDPPADPQVVPELAQAFAFRGATVYTLDVQGLGIVTSRDLFVPLLVCGDPQGAAPITRSFYDLISKTLYISFNTWVCTGFVNDTIHIYDAATWHKWGEYSTPSQYQAVPFAANLYGTSYLSRLTMHVFWARSRTDTWYEENGGGNGIALTGIVTDWGRGLLYEALWEYLPSGDVDKRIRVSNLSTRQALTTVSYDLPPVQNARLVGHDPVTDNLYFLDQGALFVVPTTSILPVD